MTTWGIFILASAVFLGLRNSLSERRRYATAAILVVGAVLYAAVRQHTY